MGCCCCGKKKVHNKWPSRTVNPHMDMGYASAYPYVIPYQYPIRNAKVKGNGDNWPTRTVVPGKHKGLIYV